MSTRAARFGDHWRASQKRKYPVRYLDLSFSGLRCFKDGAVAFSPGVTAIVGGNGVGKSTLAHAIIEVLAGPNEVHELTTAKARTDGSTLRANVEVAGTTSSLTAKPDVSGRQYSGAFNVEKCRWLEPSSMAYRCQQQVLGDSNFVDVLESAGSKTLLEDGLRLISYLVGKDYARCDVYEISDYGPFQVWPYFRVTVGGITYGSEAMGRGELALLSAYWAIDTLPQESILILEEPETHVSGRSQSALMDVLAWACATKAISAIVTSHSPIVIGKLPSESIRLLVAQDFESVILGNPRHHQLAAIVGGGVAFKCLILLEDACAQAFAFSIIERFDPDLRRQCVAAEFGGFGAICKVLEIFPPVKEWGQMIACFDGDMRSTVESQKSCFEWPYVYLPGVSGPESALRASVLSAGPNALAAELRIEQTTVTVALGSASGLDSHDWLKAVVRELGRPLEEVVRALANVWMLNNESDARSFVSDLRGALR